MAIPLIIIDKKNLNVYFCLDLFDTKVPFVYIQNT